MRPEKIKVYRTAEGTVFEIVFLVAAILLWAFIIRMLAQAPEVVPSHFDILGRPDAYGSPATIIFCCVMLAVMGAGMLATAYFPGSVNIPVKVSTPRQYSLVIRMMRVMSLLMLLLTYSVAYPALSLECHSALGVLLVTLLIVVVLAVFIFLIYCAGKVTE